jgi:hypothetical protein
MAVLLMKSYKDGAKNKQCQGNYRKSPGTRQKIQGLSLFFMPWAFSPEY